MNPGGACELDASGRSQDPRRAGARIRDTAEGVLIALRGYTLNQAFVEIVQTAKAHNLSTRSLADALVAWPKTGVPGRRRRRVRGRPRCVGAPCRPEPQRAI